MFCGPETVDVSVPVTVEVRVVIVITTGQISMIVYKGYRGLIFARF